MNKSKISLLYLSIALLLSGNSVVLFCGSGSDNLQGAKEGVSEKESAKKDYKDVLEFDLFFAEALWCSNILLCGNGPDNLQDTAKKDVTEKDTAKKNGNDVLKGNLFIVPNYDTYLGHTPLRANLGSVTKVGSEEINGENLHPGTVLIQVCGQCKMANGKMRDLVYGHPELPEGSRMGRYLPLKHLQRLKEGDVLPLEICNDKKECQKCEFTLVLGPYHQLANDATFEAMLDRIVTWFNKNPDYPMLDEKVLIKDRIIKREIGEDGKEKIVHGPDGFDFEEYCKARKERQEELRRKATEKK